LFCVPAFRAPEPRAVLRAALIGACLASLAACGHVGGKGGGRASSAQACLARAMYFESVRSSDEGMLAVGTVVMNRLESGKYPDSVCGVVGQKNQFAPGVLTREMQEGKSRERAYRVAAEVLNGKRHRGVGKAMFFHTAGRTYRFENMHYVQVAGGNAFYERKPTGRRYIPRTVIAQAGPRDSIGAGGMWTTFERPSGVSSSPVMMASAEPPRRPAARRAPPPEPVMVAAAPPPAPRMLPVAEPSIEALILASNY
jgi:hypothetical protein